MPTPAKKATTRKPATARKTAATKALEFRKLEAETLTAELTAETAVMELDALRREYELVAALPHHANIFTFYASVDRSNVAKAMHELGQWSRRTPGCDMTIVFNSPGGSVFDGMALYDYIKTLQAGGHHITTKALGMAASMGGILLQAGDTRIIGSNAWVLIHEVSYGDWGKVSHMEDEIKFSKRLQVKCLDILAERSTLSPREIAKRWLKTDWWLSAEEAVELGFADEIG